MFDCGSLINRMARPLYVLAIDVPGTAGLLYSASSRSCLIRFRRLPEGAGVLSGMRISYAGRLDRGSMDDKIQTEQGGPLEIDVAVLRAILLSWLVGCGTRDV